MIYNKNDQSTTLRKNKAGVANGLTSKQKGLPTYTLLRYDMIRKIILVVVALMFIIQPVPAQTSNDTKIMVHYMPWYQTPDVSGYWGWHWTMDHFNPDNLDNESHREIASHFYPLTGPYDSKDDDILEYQVLLMKLSGIDGVIVDWYGIENFWDYGIINQSTQALFHYIEMSHLLFSICYEDQTIGNMVTNGHLLPGQVYTHGQDVMLYLQDNWFNTNSYLKLSGKPVLLTFGPQYFHQSSDWDTLFSVLDTLPLFFTLDNRLAPVATGAFPWPPMWASQNGVLTQPALNNYLLNFYQKSAYWDLLVASTFPGFHDIYSEAGLGFSYGYLDPLDGETFQNTLDSALNHTPEVIQIVTWNDYGEGTIVEPTTEFGYQYLEMIQDTRRNSIDTTFPFTVEDLKIPIQLYNLRKSYKGNDEVNQILDSVFNLIITGDLQSAVGIIDSLNSLNSINDDNINIPGQYKLSNCYPNPFNSTTTINYFVPEVVPVTINVYDILGNEITTLVNEEVPAGKHKVEFNSHSGEVRNLSSGVYFYRMTAGSFTDTKKFILIK